MDMFKEMMKSNFTGMCEEDMENRMKSKVENGNVRTCSMVMENGDVMKCSQSMEKCGGKTCGQAMKKQVKPDMGEADHKNLVLETVEMPKALVAQMFMDVHALAQMHENLIEMYEIESQLKKQHKAYLHVRERAEKMCKNDKADLNEILDHYEHPGKYIDQALEIYADMIGEEMEEEEFSDDDEMREDTDMNDDFDGETEELFDLEKPKVAVLLKTLDSDSQDDIDEEAKIAIMKYEDFETFKENYYELLIYLGRFRLFLNLLLKGRDIEEEYLTHVLEDTQGVMIPCKDYWDRIRIFEQIK